MTDPLIIAAQALAAEAIAEGRKIIDRAETAGCDHAEVQALRDAVAALEHHAANPPAYGNDPELS